MTPVFVLAAPLCAVSASLALSPLDPSGSAPVPSAEPPAITAPSVDLSKRPTLYVVGYSHLDTQWRWTYVDTIREYIPNTLHRNFALFEKYPDYVFNFSGSRRYRMMEEYYPADFEKLRGYVASGRWFTCGSSVDENDANVPSAESLVRQVLYGNRYFRQKFSKASDEYMLPDCFGFPAALPSVLAHCGVKGFSTQKLTWNAVVPIPFKVGVWEGPDGSNVIAALDPGAYVGEVKENLANSDSWKARIEKNGQASGVLADYHYYGTGDQGGAPTERSVEMVQKSASTQGAIRVISSQADWLFNAITPQGRERLPRYKGELELIEHSAGSISSQAYMKRWNRKNELLADAAERAAVAAWWLGGRDYPAQRLEDAWYLVLGSQMHDILPGTSVPRAYDLSWNDEVIAANQFAQVLADGAGAVIGRMDTRNDGADSATIVVFNPLSIERQDVVEADVSFDAPALAVIVTGPDGKPVPSQIISNPPPGRAPRVAFLAKAPSVGFAAYKIRAGVDAPSASALRVSERQLENEVYTVKLDDHGDIASIFDKSANRELLASPARVGLHYENPRNWPAWNQDWADRQLPAKAFAGDEGPVTFTVVERGPARIAVEVKRRAEGSTFTQRIRLTSGSPRIEFDTDIDWRTRERSVRAAFPLTVSNPMATYDIQTGAIERPNAAANQFEYPFHQWFDLTDAKRNYGASLMCDSKYASDKPDDHTVRLTLLHTPGTRGGYPDQGSQDLGRHHVLYALCGHAGDWRKGNTPQQAARLNQPMAAFRAAPHAGPLGASFSLLRTSSPAAVAVTAIKKAEQSAEIVIRLRELTGSAAGGVRVTMAAPILSARQIDGQERPLGPATVTAGELVCDVPGFGLKAFALTLGPADARATRPRSETIALAFDTDAVSTNAKRSDGSFNGRGQSIPAEQFPSTLTYNDVVFTLGPTADGKSNALTCRGQSMALPGGNFDRVYLIAAADEELTTDISIDGASQPWKVQSWTGMIGQWDRRLWPGEGTGARPAMARDITGIEPGFVKPDDVAWFCSHHHTPDGDAIYEYCYLFAYALDIPAGAKSLRLPSDPRVKVFAISAVSIGAARASLAAPVFDTLADHRQDPPRVVVPKGAATDAIEVTVEPGLYWRDGAVRYTLDGSDPVAASPAYTGPIVLSRTATVKAAIFDAAGKPGPAASATVEVNDRTAPTLKGAVAVYQSPVIWLEFSEPLDASSAAVSHFALNPAIAVTSVDLAPDGRRVSLTLASPPEADRAYQLKITGIKDRAPSANTMPDASIALKTNAPVYTLAELKPDQRGTTIKDIPGLPVKAGDAWTLNAFIRTESDVPIRTLIVGFGRLDNLDGGAGRYLARFANGLHFWSHNRDVESRSRIDRRTWLMLTATYDGHVLRLYRDGRKVAERAVELADDQNEIHLAPMDPWEKQRQFAGEIRGLSIWNAALSEDSIKALRGSVALP